MQGNGAQIRICVYIIVFCVTVIFTNIFLRNLEKNTGRLSDDHMLELRD